MSMRRITLVRTSAGGMPFRKGSGDRPSRSRPLPGAVEETSQALPDDLFGVRHDTVDQFLHRRDVANETRDHAATPGAGVHIAVDHHLGIDASDLLMDVANLQACAL